MLKITNMKWKYGPFNNPSALIKIMNLKFKELNLTVKMSSKEGTIAFSDVVDGKTFISSVDNVINMKENDPRLKKIGRTYLLSKRPTEEQYNGFFNVIQSTLDSVGLYGNVELIIARTSESILLRDGIERVGSYPKMKSFPTKLIKGEAV